MTRLVVKTHHHPWRVASITALVVVTLLGVAYAMYQRGAATAAGDFNRVQQDNTRLLATNRDLSQELAQLRSSQAIAERDRQVEQQAYKEMQSNVTTLQEQLSQLRGELAFYKGIVTPGGGEVGLRIQRLDVAPSGVARGYRFKLVLTQVAKNDTVIAGTVSIRVEGSRGGELTQLELGSLGFTDSDPIPFKFRYFQNLEGEIVLPEGFQPIRTLVSVDPRGRGSRDKLEKTFDWPAEEN